MDDRLYKNIAEFELLMYNFPIANISALYSKHNYSDFLAEFEFYVFFPKCKMADQYDQPIE